MKRLRLTEDEKKSVAYSPEAVVSCVRQIAQETLAKLNMSVDMVVEPCAGDGRLGRAVFNVVNVSRAKKEGLLLFDVCPAEKKVKKFNVLRDRDMAVVSRSMTGHRCMVVLNPPYNPKEELRRICVASLGLPGAETSILVLPGVYRDPLLLDKLIPRWWHVEAIENMDFQKFEQPLLEKTTSDLMLAIVFLVRKSYLRQSPVESEDKLESQRLFQFVAENGDWDQAFQTGAIQHPIQIKMPGQIRPYGRWRFVKYLQCSSDAETARICNLVKVRTAYATEKGIFPVHGTTDRISVSKEAVCDWLNQILTGDEQFFQGLLSKSRIEDDEHDESDDDKGGGRRKIRKRRKQGTYNDENNVSARSARSMFVAEKDLNGDNDDNDDNDNGKNDVVVNDHGNNVENPVIDPADIWCIELEQSCRLRANAAKKTNGGTLFGNDFLSQFKLKQRRIVQDLIVKLQGTEYEQCFFAGLKLQSVLKKSAG